MKRPIFVLLLTCALAAPLPVLAQPGRCEAVGGVLMTNINVVNGDTNMGPAFGDLAGSVAAKIVGNAGTVYTIQHYWVTAAGDTITFKPATLNAVPISMTVAAVPWGSYSSDISGGTGKFDGASGTLNYFGLADFAANTLVLRYRGTVCYKNVQAATKK